MFSKSTLVLLLFALLTVPGFTQKSVPEVIDEQVWRPFVKAFGELDHEGILSLMTSNMIRIDLDGEYILSGGHHSEAVTQGAERAENRKMVRTIDLSFTQRFHTDDVAYESGYFRVNLAEGGLQRVNYGYFTVILQRIDGTWKIATDIIGSDDGKVLEEDFMRGTPLEWP